MEFNDEPPDFLPYKIHTSKEIHVQLLWLACLDPTVLQIPDGSQKHGKVESVQESHCSRKTSPKVKHDRVSRQCLLNDRDEGAAVARHLSYNGLTYVPVNPKYNHCFFEAVLCVFPPPVKVNGFVYTAYHLRLQVCKYMIDNYQECTDILRDRLVAYETSLGHFINKFAAFDEWGEEILLNIICRMWKVKITVLDVTDFELMRHYGSDSLSNNVIVYNGHSHYSGTAEIAKQYWSGMETMLRQTVLHLYFDRKKEGKMFDKADLDELVKEYKDTMDLNKRTEYEDEEWFEDMDLVEQKMLEDEIIEQHETKSKGTKSAKKGKKSDDNKGTAASSSPMETRTQKRKKQEVIQIDDDGEEVAAPVKKKRKSLQHSTPLKESQSTSDKPSQKGSRTEKDMKGKSEESQKSGADAVATESDKPSQQRASKEKDSVKRKSVPASEGIESLFIDPEEQSQKAKEDADAMEKSITAAAIQAKEALEGESGVAAKQAKKSFEPENVDDMDDDVNKAKQAKKSFEPEHVDDMDDDVIKAKKIQEDAESKAEKATVEADEAAQNAESLKKKERELLLKSKPNEKEPLPDEEVQQSLTEQSEQVQQTEEVVQSEELQQGVQQIQEERSREETEEKKQLQMIEDEKLAKQLLAEQDETLAKELANKEMMVMGEIHASVDNSGDALGPLREKTVRSKGRKKSKDEENFLQAVHERDRKNEEAKKKQREAEAAVLKKVPVITAEKIDPLLKGETFLNVSGGGFKPYEETMFRRRYLDYKKEILSDSAQNLHLAKLNAVNAVRNYNNLANVHRRMGKFMFDVTNLSSARVYTSKVKFLHVRQVEEEDLELDDFERCLEPVKKETATIGPKQIGEDVVKIPDDDDSETVEISNLNFLKVQNATLHQHSGGPSATVSVAIDSGEQAFPEVQEEVVGAEPFNRSELRPSDENTDMYDGETIVIDKDDREEDDNKVKEEKEDDKPVEEDDDDREEEKKEEEEEEEDEDEIVLTEEEKKNYMKVVKLANPPMKVKGWNFRQGFKEYQKQSSALRHVEKSGNKLDLLTQSAVDAKDATSFLCCTYPGCPVARSSRRGIESHLLKHTNVRYCCPTCNHAYVTKCSVEKCITAHVTGMIPCDVCGDFKRTQSVMKLHMNKHLKGPLLKCKVKGCDAPFLRHPGDKHRHFEIHHEDLLYEPKHFKNLRAEFYTRDEWVEHLKKKMSERVVPKTDANFSFTSEKKS